LNPPRLCGFAVTNDYGSSRNVEGQTRPFLIPGSIVGASDPINKIYGQRLRFGDPFT